jgi:hypothetical protein
MQQAPPASHHNPPSLFKGRREAKLLSNVLLLHCISVMNRMNLLSNISLHLLPHARLAASVFTVRRACALCVLCAQSLLPEFRVFVGVLEVAPAMHTVVPYPSLCAARGWTWVDVGRISCLVAANLPPTITRLPPHDCTPPTSRRTPPTCMMYDLTNTHGNRPKLVETQFVDGLRVVGSSDSVLTLRNSPFWTVTPS